MTSPVTMPIDESAWTLDTHEDAASFVRLGSEWAELLRESEADGLFLTWEWLYTWWKHLSAGYKLHIVVLRRAGEMIAVAPWVLRRASLWHLPPMRTLQFLGSGVVGSDYLDLIVRRGHEAEAVRILCDRVNASGRALSLMRMRPRGSGATLVEHLERQGWRARQGQRELCPFVSLRGHSFESYLASLGSEHRYAFRRKLGQLERRSGVRFELTRTEFERRDGMACLFALHDLRWRARGEPGAFSTGALRAFHDEISRVALEAGWLRLWVLRVDAEPVAALYGFLYRRTFYFYQSGFDPQYARQSVGLVLLGVAVRAAMAEGVDEFDLLHGTERYKGHWANATRELLRFELYAPGTRGLLESEASALTREARRVTRVLLDAGRRVVVKTS